MASTVVIPGCGPTGFVSTPRKRMSGLANKFGRLGTAVLIMAVCIAPLPAAEATILSGWFWVMPTQSGPYFYSLDDSSWYYLDTSAGTHQPFACNMSTGQWTDEIPDGWTWFAWPYVYTVADATWYFISPPEGMWWFYSFAAGQWIHMP